MYVDILEGCIQKWREEEWGDGEKEVVERRVMWLNESANGVGFPVMEGVIKTTLPRRGAEIPQRPQGRTFVAP